MEVVVDGTDVSREELDQPGWMEAHKALGSGRTTKKAAAGAFMDASATSKQTDASQTASQKSIAEKSGASKPGEPSRPRRRAPPPQMPANDYKIVVRPRDELNLSVCSEAEIADCIRKTLRFPDTTTITDVVQVNRAQNLVLISTPDEGRAKTYSGLSEILLHGKSYKKTYIASHPPQAHPDYTGPDAPTMDAPILEAEPTPHSLLMRPPTDRLELSPPEPMAQPRSERGMR
ncbi:hypothetical protein HPB52_019921 [Rhipicephalus sanguineus]|uniref:Uncharacterized protein n=1 Tax=Rhipicephalus sanguineus TaxID=34632 RepID=A0A9D4PK16_RHISA|nr:hypothetical protein HPB52_019921 [Rhipicephalus sanguineus]